MRLAATAALCYVLSFSALSRGLPAQVSPPSSDGLESASTRPAVTATISQRVHPVLLRKDRNPLARITVDVPEGAAAVEVGSFTIGLDGSDDISDLAGVELFYSGTAPELSSDRRFGELIEPAQRMTFAAKLTLAPGCHHFWLSVRLKQGANLLHEVDATCTRIETATGHRITPSDQTPGVRKRIGIALRKHNDDGVHTYRIPALTTTPRGTLLCVYDMRRRRSRDLQEDIDIGLSRSTDGGATWEPPRVILDMGEWGGLPEEQNGCSDPGIVVDRETGEIFCSAVWMWGKPGKHQWSGDGSEPGFEIGRTAQFLTVRSRDDGITWSRPVNHTRVYKREEWWLFAPSPSAGITLNDGTLIMPSQGRDRNGTPFSNILVSRDHGRTWTVSPPAFTGSSECQAVQLSDGSLMLNMRNERSKRRFFRSVCVTDDLGETWRTHSTHQSALIEPNCNGSLLRARYRVGGESRSVLLFANPHATDGRHHHSLQVSFDDGRTWPASHRLLLDEGRGRGYPSLTQIDEEHVGIVYEGSQADLVFEKLSLARLLEPSTAFRRSANSRELWDAALAVPKAEDLTQLEGVEFHVIKRREPEVDGYSWLHGIALEWHRGRLYASFGHNSGSENTATEEARGRVSTDGGKTWGDVFTIDDGQGEPDLAVSHGVLLSRGGELWAFCGAFYNRLERVHTRAYVLDDSTGAWRKKGTVVREGFWPMQRPLEMADGNRIMAGFIAGQGNPAAVAISHGADLLEWDLVAVPKMPDAEMWGESSVIVDGHRVINVARYGERAEALVSLSEDRGRTWTPSVPGNLPMVTSKPYAGTLSTGQRYLIATTTADSGKRRSPLTIAVGRRGESRFSKIYRIRGAVHAAGPGESHPAAGLAYPYAVEREGKLYVAFSNDGGRGGNRNSAELAVIPIASLRVD